MTVRNLDALFHPRRLLVLGEPSDAATRELFAQAQASFAPDARWIAAGQAPGWQTLAADWPSADLAVVLDPSWMRPGTLARLAASSVRAVIVACAAADLTSLLAEGRPSGLRLLGARSAGAANPRNHVRLTTLPSALQAGSVALIAQSQSLAAAAVDWAAGRRIGFSWLALTGTEADVDVADLLDYAALDPDTKAVVVQLGRIAQGRKFMSAARACARGKPVVVLQSDASPAPAGATTVRSSAFQRAGLVECESLAGLFDALAALDRLPHLSGNQVVVLGNGGGVCMHGVGALLRHGLVPQVADDDLRGRLLAKVPALGFVEDAIDLGEADGAQTVLALRELFLTRDVHAAILLRGPTAEAAHQEVAHAVAEAGFDNRLLTAWLGLESALPARALSTQAHMATFTSADAAARAIRYRWQHHRTQELLTQTPEAAPLEPIASGHVTGRLRALALRGVPVRPRDAGALLSAYGVPVSRRASTYATAALRVTSHPEFGSVIELRPALRGVERPWARALPPLDNLLARRLLEDAGYRADYSDGAFESLAGGLIRIADLVVDQPLVQELELRLGSASGHRVWALPGATLRLRNASPGERQRLALAPYPAGLAHQFAARDGSRFQCRPVRPADEPALLRLLEAMPAEDIRLRFFIGIRYFSHAMAARMTQIDYDRELALVAFPIGAPDELVAIATMIASPDTNLQACDPQRSPKAGDDASAEFAVLVQHSRARQGLGRHLLQRLLDHAACSGITKVYGEVLPENEKMLALARSLGFRETRNEPDWSHVRVEYIVGSTTAPPAPVLDRSASYIG